MNRNKHKIFYNISILIISLLFCISILEFFANRYYSITDFIQKDYIFFSKVGYKERNTTELDNLYDFDKIERPSDNIILGRELIPNSEGKIGGVYVKINSDGFRDREYTIKKPNNTFRIAVIGDSFTFGDGVLSNETYAKILEQKLNQDSNMNIEVINFGVYGYNINQILELYKTKVKKYNPDLVLYGYFPNDPQDTSENCNLTNIELTEFIKKQKPISLYFLKINFYKIYNRQLYGTYIGYHIGLHSKESLEWYCTSKSLNELSSQDTKLIMFPIPILSKFSVLNKTVYNSLRTQNISYFDLPYYFEFQKDKYNESQFYAVTHYSYLTYTVFAEGLKEYLINGNYLPK